MNYYQIKNTVTLEGLLSTLSIRVPFPGPTRITPVSSEVERDEVINLEMDKVPLKKKRNLKILLFGSFFDDRKILE